MGHSRSLGLWPESSPNTLSQSPSPVFRFFHSPFSSEPRDLHQPHCCPTPSLTLAQSTSGDQRHLLYGETRTLNLELTLQGSRLEDSGRRIPLLLGPEPILPTTPPDPWTLPCPDCIISQARSLSLSNLSGFSASNQEGREHPLHPLPLVSNVCIDWGLLGTLSLPRVFSTI